MATYRITGKTASVDGFNTCLRQWQINVSGVDTVASCSSAAGAVFRGTGNSDWSGVIVGYGLPPKYPGEYFTFTGSDREGQGWLSSNSADSRGSALVARLHVFCPIQTGKHIFYHLYFLGNGRLDKGAYSATPVGPPAPLNPRGLSFKIDGASVNGVLGWELMLDCNPTAPIWPSQSDGWPGRDPGDLDAEITWQQTFDAMSQIPAINTFCQFGLYVTSTTYYDVKWGQVLSTPVIYPIEGSPPGSAEYVELRECKAKFSGWNDSVQGFIKKPGAVTYWPT